jgi:hypothetical protein
MGVLPIIKIHGPFVIVLSAMRFLTKSMRGWLCCPFHRDDSDATETSANLDCLADCRTNVYFAWLPCALASGIYLSFALSQRLFDRRLSSASRWCTSGQQRTMAQAALRSARRLTRCSQPKACGTLPTAAALRHGLDDTRKRVRAPCNLGTILLLFGERVCANSLVRIEDHQQ